MIIFYFSATGNSLSAAKRIGGDLVSIPQVIESEHLEYKDDVIGLIFPIYSLRPPKMVRRFADYVTRNIRYTNKNAKSNYRSYLLKALQNDYGLAMQEDEESARQVVAQEAIKMQAIAQSEAVEQKRLSEESRADLQAEAITSMSDNIKEIVLKKGLGSKIMLNMAMENIALQKLAEINASKPVQPTLEMAA